MNAESVIADLEKAGVTLSLSKTGIILETQVGEVSIEAIEFAKRNKPALIAHLRPMCSPHNNDANYLDAPVAHRSGWIKTTCRVCGKFIGYRNL